MTSRRDANGPTAAHHSTASVRTEARGTLLIFFLWLLFLSFYPFETVTSFAEYLDNLRQGIAQPFVTAGMAKHVLAFGLLGLLLALVQITPKRSSGSLLKIVCFLVVLSIVIELVQAAIPARHCRAGDVLIHTASGAGGAWVGLWFLQQTFAIRLLQSSMRTAWATALIVAVGAVVGLTVITGPYGSSISNWDPNYELAIGNEHTGDRPWRGEMLGIAMYPIALSARDAMALSTMTMSNEFAVDPRRALGAIWVLPFNEGEGDRIQSAVLESDLPNLDMEFVSAESAIWNPDGHGIRLSGRGGVHSAEPHPQLTSILRQTNSYSIEILCSTADLHQRGPARLLSLSQNTSHRNVTLGQDGTELVLRMRTPLNGRNGSRLPGRWPGVFACYDRKHIVVTYDGATMRAFVNGAEQLPAQSLQTLGLALGLRDNAAALMLALLFFVPIGVCGRMVWSHRPLVLRMSLVAAVTFVPVALATASMWLMFERAPGLGMFVLAFPALLLGDLIALHLRQSWSVGEALHVVPAHDAHEWLRYDAVADRT